MTNGPVELRPGCQKGCCKTFTHGWKGNQRPGKLTLACTCYFPILERTWGGCNPHAISPIIEIELWDENQTNAWDVLSPMVPGLTSSGHILTHPGRVKVKKDSDLRMYRFSKITFELKKIADPFKHYRVSLFKTHWKIYCLTSKGQVENLA